MALHPPPGVRVRPAVEPDTAALASIYNHYIRHTLVTFEEEDVSAATMAERVRDVVASGLPYLVAETNGEVVGYAYASKWKPRYGYRFSAEVSVYLAPDQTGRGYGRLLYEHLLPELEARGFRTAVGGIALPNEASIALHESLGFEKVAEFREIGIKFGEWTNVGYWQRIFPAS